MLSLKTTPFHARTSALMQGNQWRRWSGYTVASAYELTHDREYLAMRNACALIDVSALCKYHIRGRDARAFLNRLVTRDVTKLAPGQGLYTPWCNSSGKVVDDGTIACLEEGYYRLTAAETNNRWLALNSPGFEVSIEDVSDQLGTLALQGPHSRAVLVELFGEEAGALKFYEWCTASYQGRTVGISRTGYSGDLGYEIWVPAEHALFFWDALVGVGKRYALQPAGIWALDVARIEAGLIMLDVDYTPVTKTVTDAQASSPYELGLGWSVNFKKGPFVGRDALAREKEAGSPYKLVGLEIDHVAYMAAFEELGLPPCMPFQAWRATTPLFDNGGQVGYATCGTWSPTLKKYIALGQVHPSCGSRVTVDLMVDRYRRSFFASVVGLPFFNPERKRA